MRGQRWLRILAGVLTVVVGLSLFAGCSFYKVKEDGEALTYDICDDTMLPEELLSVINSKKEEPFNLTYSNNTYTYIVICSGRQNRDDVGVVVDKMYMDENAIYIESVLRQTATPSDAVSKDLQKRGMKFVGSTIIYSFLQAVGIIYSHEKECFLYKSNV